MATLSQAARSTPRLGMTEGPIAQAGLTPDQYARGAQAMKNMLGIAAPATSTQLSAVAGARRSASTEPRATLYSTLGQRLSAVDAVRKTVSDHYAQYDAGKRKLLRDQEEATAEQGRQQAVSLAQAAEQRAVRERALSEQQRQTAGAIEERMAREAADAKAFQERMLAYLAEEQARIAGEQEGQLAALDKQRTDYEASVKAAEKASREAERKPKREYFTNLIQTRQDNYMRNIGERDPNALVVYDPGLAARTSGPDRYSVEIPDMPKALYPEDDSGYTPPSGLPDIEDYLVPYDVAFGVARTFVHPAYTPVFWQLKPEEREGYLAAWQAEKDPEYGMGSIDHYLETIGFTPDPNKPLIKEPMPGWQPTPGRPQAATTGGASAAPAPTTTPADQMPSAIAREPHGPATPPANEPALPAGNDYLEPSSPQAKQPLSYGDAARRYLEENPDVARAGMDAWFHWSMYGQGEGRNWPGAYPDNPTPGFTDQPAIPSTPAAPAQMSYGDAARRYLEENPDVARAGMDAWFHWSMFGQGEGRPWPGAYPDNPTPGFTDQPAIPSTPAAPVQMNFYDAQRKYLEDNPDVARAGVDPWLHWQLYGQSEGRQWPGEYDPSWYSAGGD